MKINLLRNLLDGSEVFKARLDKITFEELGANEYEGKKLTARKLRAGLNLLTSKVSMSEEDPDKVSKELRPWYDAIKIHAKSLPADHTTITNDEEMKNFIMSVQDGLKLCEYFFSLASTDVSGDFKRKKMRGVFTDYQVASNQAMNLGHRKQLVSSGPMSEQEKEKLARRGVRKMKMSMMT